MTEHAKCRGCGGAATMRMWPHELGGCAFLALMAGTAIDACWLFVRKLRGVGDLRYVMRAVDAYKAAGHYPPKKGE